MPETVDAEQAALERVLRGAADGLERADAASVPPLALQRLLAACVRVYEEKRTAGEDFGPFDDERAVSATAVMVAAANMLQAADVEPFELGMWIRQSRT